MLCKLNPDNKKYKENLRDEGIRQFNREIQVRIGAAIETFFRVNQRWPSSEEEATLRKEITESLRNRGITPESLVTPREEL